MVVIKNVWTCLGIRQRNMVYWPDWIQNAKIMQTTYTWQQMHTKWPNKKKYLCVFSIKKWIIDFKWDVSTYALPANEWTIIRNVDIKLSGHDAFTD